VRKFHVLVSWLCVRDVTAPLAKWQPVELLTEVVSSGGTWGQTRHYSL